MPATLGGEAVLVAVPSGGGHLSTVYYGKCLLWITGPDRSAYFATGPHVLHLLGAVRGADVFPLGTPAYPAVESGRLHLDDAHTPVYNGRHVARAECHAAYGKA